MGSDAWNAAKATGKIPGATSEDEITTTIVDPVTNVPRKVEFTPEDEQAHARRREAWVAALRSGNYMQGKQRLRGTDNSFCCLGVACDLYGKENGVEWERENEERDEYSFLNHSGTMPVEVTLWLGFRSPTGGLGSTDEREPLWKTEYSLAGANDSGATFAEIADVIEARGEEL